MSDDPDLYWGQIEELEIQCISGSRKPLGDESE
jgi:hypothetical protein